MNGIYDAVVIGGGPAGLTAAIYLARARFRTLVIERGEFGGQILTTSEVVNYPGITRIDGRGLSAAMREQAVSFGAEFMVAEATGIRCDGDMREVVTDRGTIGCFGVIVATGASPRPAGFEGEDRFRGRGVAFCATCDGEFFTGKRVFVIGSGHAAAEEAVFLTTYVSHVTVLIRGAGFKCARSSIDAVAANPKIDVLTDTVVESVSGDTALRSMRYRNRRTGEVSEYVAPEGDTFGVFVFAGRVPMSGILEGMADIDDAGYVVTGPDLMTRVEGVYAAGDLRAKDLRQVVTATADGAVAATGLEKRLADMRARTGIVPSMPEKAAEAPREEPAGGELFPPEMRAQLDAVFSRMSDPLVLELTLDGSGASRELEAYMDGLASMTGMLSVSRDGAVPEHAPCVRVMKGGEWTGLAFHGVPGGHEFTSFVLGLYNASGPGQPIDPGTADAARALEPVDVKVLVSLSCTMCPDTVVAAQRIASLNLGVTAQVYDVARFPDLKDRYGAMSVPCIVAGDRIEFGRKTVQQMIGILRRDRWKPPSLRGWLYHVSRCNQSMREIERMRAGMPFSVRDPEVYASKLRAAEGCRRLNSVDLSDSEGREAAIRDLFGSAGRGPVVLPVFSCDTGSNIHVGDYFLANYNVTILDIAEFRAGDNVWIGPGTLISTIGHPLSPMQRRRHIGIAEPVTVGSDVWIGGNATVLPGVTIGDNVVVGAGAVVTRDVPDDSLVLGVPARVVRGIPDDTGDPRRDLH